LPSFIQGNLVLKRISPPGWGISAATTVREKYEKAEDRKEKEMEERENK
jgi:hypothetical protein